MHFLPIFTNIALPVKQSFTSKPVNQFYRFLPVKTSKNSYLYLQAGRDDRAALRRDPGEAAVCGAAAGPEGGRVDRGQGRTTGPPDRMSHR